MLVLFIHQEMFIRAVRKDLCGNQLRMRNNDTLPQETLKTTCENPLAETVKKVGWLYKEKKKKKTSTGLILSYLFIPSV